MTEPLLGFITKTQRNKAQHDASDIARARMVKLTLPAVTLPKGTKVILTDVWKDPDVVADIGKEFTGFHQLTGSCVGASTGNAVFTLGAVQRKLTEGTTKAFVPWWPFDYGRCRYNEGDRGQGEGAIDSVMAQTLIREGCFGINEADGLPPFDTADGFALTSHIEMQYSDGAFSGNTQFQSLASKHLVKSAAVLNSPADIKAAITNGFPVLDGCENYIGHGSVEGDMAVGHYDGRGGHSTCFLGYWEHPDKGPHYLYSNQWPGSTYPNDGSGKGRCCVWTPESEVAKLFHTGGSGGETVALSHLDYFPAQPTVISWFA